jgi:act minimal PKS acyl carrier protein
MSKEITIQDLRRILNDCAGCDDTFPPDDDVSHVPFDDLGYDSLVLIEAVGTLKREYGVVIPDDQITEVKTFGALLALINELVAA